MMMQGIRQMTPGKEMSALVEEESDGDNIPCATINVHLVCNTSLEIAQNQTKTILIALPPIGMRLTCSVVHLLLPSPFFRLFKNRPK
jgi:hypothetical protein